jgi:hypothetical protein
MLWNWYGHYWLSTEHIHLQHYSEGTKGRQGFRHNLLAQTAQQSTRSQFELPQNKCYPKNIMPPDFWTKKRLC